jgi:hypothetical protein
MSYFLANADATDNSLANIVLAAECLVLMGVVFALAAVPVLLAKRRGPRGGLGDILAVAVVWGLLTAGTAMYTLVMHVQWSRTYTARLLSGDYDPTAPDIISDQPKQPWLLWGAEAAGYIGLLAWSYPKRT